MLRRLDQAGLTLTTTATVSAELAGDYPKHAQIMHGCPIRLQRPRDKENPMWSNEHTIETSAAPEAIWRLWADVAGWPAWNGDIERIELHGPFAAGGRIVMTPMGGADRASHRRGGRARALRRRS